MRLRARTFLSASLILAFSACEKGSTTTPTPPPQPCSYALSVATLSFGPAGGSGAVSVTTASPCAWIASSDREWISITGGASGTGSGTVTIGVSANPTTVARTGALTIAGQVVSVREDGLAPCAVTLSPTSASFGKDAATGTVAVTTPVYCQWSAISAAGWLSITSGAQGTGNGTVAYAVERNRETNARSATIVVNEKNFGVTQAGDVVSCDYAVSPVEFTPCMSVPFNLTATVMTQPTCAWTATTDASWISVTGGQAGSGAGAVTFHVSDNWDAPRQGIVMVRWPTLTAGQNLRVLQAGCYYAVSTAAISMGAAGGSGRFDVIQQSDPNNCGGPLQNACLWITVTSTMPQVGDNPVNFVVVPNDSVVQRSGTIVVRDKRVRITQAGR
jgi:hypothetical protein